MKECSESECSKEAQYLRATQFSGDHYFCEDHAILEEDYGDNNSYAVWYEIVKVFRPNKFTSPIVFKRAINTNHKSVAFEGKGFCTWDQLKAAIEEAEDVYCRRLHRVYGLLQKYSKAEEHLSPEASKFEFNTEKFQDAVSVGTVSKQEVLDIKYLEKEGVIETTDDVRVLELYPIQIIMYTFK